LWTVKLGGWLPALNSCGRCGRAFKEKEPQYFSVNALAMLCDKCRQGAGRLFSQLAIAAAKKMLAEHLERIGETDIESHAAREVSEVMLDIIESQIDRKLKSREMLEQTPWP
jgi:recombinational DNA repair protein (RecF pathway)